MYICSVEAAMDVIGGKWKPHILLKIKDAPLRFGAIQEKLPAISQKMLTRQLRALEADRLVSRMEYPGMPPRVEYSLTARGQTVIPLLMSLKDWASEELADQISEHEHE
jgi:DNA-binding HxlR family transcriptional regulator